MKPALLFIFFLMLASGLSAQSCKTNSCKIAADSNGVFVKHNPEPCPPIVADPGCYDVTDNVTSSRENEPLPVAARFQSKALQLPELRTGLCRAEDLRLPWKNKTPPATL